MAEPLISDVKPLEKSIPLIVEENQTPIIFQGDSEELSEEESKNIDSEIITPIVEDESEVIETETLFKGDSEEVDITEEDTPILFKGDTKEDEVSTLDKLEYGWDKNQWVAANLLYRIPRNYVESLFSEKTFEDVAIENEAERLADFEEEHYKMLDGQHDGAYTMIGEAASFFN